MKTERIITIFFVALCLLGLTLVGGFLIANHLNTPPVAADIITTTTIEPGTTTANILVQLQEETIIRSELFANLLMKTRYRDQLLQAGTYSFAPGTYKTTDVIEKIIAGDAIIENVILTFIEGERVWQFGKKAAEQLENFNLDEWNSLTSGQEGFLFPDTYFVAPDYTALQVYELLQSQFDLVLTEVTQNSSRLDTTETIVTVASILEREANTPQSKGLVAGILYNRLDIGMALQADATIEYALEMPLGELPPGQLAVELRELDSPYNSYLYPGLPPTPIGNPGRTALLAAANPTPSKYLFYITGNDGEFYYAETYNEHLRNIERHLR